MVKLICTLMILPMIGAAQIRTRPMIIPQRDSIREMQYAINGYVFNNGVTEKVNYFNVRNGFWLSIPQDTFMLAKYRGWNHGTPDTLLWIRRGNVRMSPLSEFRLPYSQVTGTPTTWAWANVTGKPAFFSGSYNDLTDKPSTTTGRTATAVTRAFNSAFTPSATRDVLATYTVTIRMPLTLLGLVYGQIYLETSPNGTTWTSVGLLGNGDGSIVGSGSVSAQLSFLVPAGYQVRLRSVAQGAVTFVYVHGFETII